MWQHRLIIFAFEPLATGFFPHPLWCLGLITSLKAMPFIHMGSRGRCWILRLLCFKKHTPQTKKKPNPTPLSSSYYTKRESFCQNQWEILNCLHAQLSVERFSTQTSFRKLHGNKMNKTASMGQSRQEGVVFFGVWDKSVSTHLFWQGHGCRFRAVVGENFREQRVCCWTCSPNASIAYQQYLASGCGFCRMFRIVWLLTLLVLLGLLYSPGMPFFRLLCVGERKDTHINVSSFVLDWVFIDFKVQAFQPWLGLWSSPMVTSLQKEEHQSQEWLVLLADGDLIVALLCSTRMHSRKNTTEQEPTQQSL